MSDVLEDLLEQVKQADKEIVYYSEDVDVLIKKTKYTHNGLGKPVHTFYRVKSSAHSSEWFLNQLDSLGNAFKGINITEELAIKLIEDASYYCSNKFFAAQISISKAKNMIGINE